MVWAWRGHLGLLAQRSQLPANLGREVLDAGEVALHRVELAQRLVLAPPMLEDAGGLLNEVPALLGGSTQHGIELSLTHDHVHLAAKA